MRTISYKVSYEKMISRLPAMFAYLDIDEQGTCEIVKATNGKQGDYGRIIANIVIVILVLIYSRTIYTDKFIAVVIICILITIS